MTGEILERDAETGRILEKKLSSEEASALSKRRWEKDSGGKVERLLESRGIDPNNADEGLLSLARLATKGGAGSVQALRYFDKLTGVSDIETEPPKQSAHKVEFIDDISVMIDGKLYMRASKDMVFSALGALRELKDS